MGSRSDGPAEIPKFHIAVEPNLVLHPKKEIELCFLFLYLVAHFAHIQREREKERKADLHHPRKRGEGLKN